MQLDSAPILDQRDLSSDRSAEIELLLCCSHTHPNEHQLARIQSLVRQQLDWTYLLERATYHHILPLIDRQLQQIDDRVIPADAIDRIRANFNDNFQHNLRLTSELVKLGRLFELRSIPMLSFKGPILARIAYENLALRQFIDLDILVYEIDVIRTSQLLISQGYQPQFTLTDRQQTVYTKLRSEQWFWHEEKQICVDLHWSILPNSYSFTPDPQLIWQQIDRVEFGSQSIATLNPEHLLLFLCAHGAKHNWSRLYWICDLAELLRTHEHLDWKYLLDLSGRFGSKKMLFLGLYLASQFLESTLPENISIELESDSTLSLLSTQIHELLFHPQHVDESSISTPSVYVAKAESPPLASIIKQDFIYRQTMTSSRDRLWYWIDTILTPTPLEWQIVSLPQMFFWMYYSIRLMRLTIKYLRGSA
jgi:Uncharacterised nucleotidyltransferase